MLSHQLGKLVAFVASFALLEVEMLGMSLKIQMTVSTMMLTVGILVEV